MSFAQVLGTTGVVLALLLLDVSSRRARYRDPGTRPVRSAAMGGLLLLGAWLVASYFGRSGLHLAQVQQALLVGSLWFVGAALAGVLLQRSAARRAK